MNTWFHKLGIQWTVSYLFCLSAILGYYFVNRGDDGRGAAFRAGSRNLGTAAAYPERDSWKKVTSSFSSGYGREGHNLVAVKTDNGGGMVPFTLLALGGMTIDMSGRPNYMGDTSVSRDEGRTWVTIPKVPGKSFTRRWSAASAVVRVYNLVNNQAYERIVVIGGFYSYVSNSLETKKVFLNDVWTTDLSMTDGNATLKGLAWNWTNTTDVCVEKGTSLKKCVFSERYGHSLIAFGGNMARTDVLRGPGQVSSYLILIGGRTRFGFRSDVWISKDGGNSWTEQSSRSRFSPRAYHSCVTYGKKIFVYGGRASSSSSIYNDVWRSSDAGKTFQRMASEAKWEKRYRAMAVAYPLDKTFNTGIIAIMGGYQSGTSTLFSDFYISADDGASWTLQHSNLPFGERSAGAACVVPRHTPDYWPQLLDPVPGGTTDDESFYPMTPFVLCGGMSHRNRLNDCYLRLRNVVATRAGASAKGPLSIGSLAIFLAITLELWSILC